MTTICIPAFTLPSHSIQHPDLRHPHRFCDLFDITASVGLVGALPESCTLRERLFPPFPSCYVLLNSSAPLLQSSIAQLQAVMPKEKVQGRTETSRSRPSFSFVTRHALNLDGPMSLNVSRIGSLLCHGAGSDARCFQSCSVQLSRLRMTLDSDYRL